jgi:trans-2,3-dihydro-3-hydroxyanthranilate isomerase
MGLSPSDVAGVPAHLAGCGLPFTYLAVQPGAVDRAVPDVAALDGLGVGEGVSVLSWDAESSTAYARVFAGDLHWDEDPATGSAALGTGVWLVATGLLPGDGTSSFVVRQGEKIGRPAVLRCTVTATGGTARSATVRGAVVPIASGRIRIP